MFESSESFEPPGDYKQAGLLMLISGVLNVMNGMLWSFIGLSTCLGTYGICCFCPIIGVAPFFLGLYEAIIGLKMSQGERVHSTAGINASSLVFGVLTFNFITVVLETLAMISLNKPEVAAFLDDPLA